MESLPLVFLSDPRYAKERKLRIWRDYVAPTANLDQKDKQFVAKVRGRHLRGEAASGPCWGISRQSCWSGHCVKEGKRLAGLWTGKLLLGAKS